VEKKNQILENYENDDNESSTLALDDFEDDKKKNRKSLLKKRLIDSSIYYFDIPQDSVLLNVNDLCFKILKDGLTNNQIISWKKCQSFIFSDFKFDNK
jgi:hypothetical protein